MERPPIGTIRDLCKYYRNPTVPQNMGIFSVFWQNQPKKFNTTLFGGMDVVELLKTHVFHILVFMQTLP